MKKLFVVMSIVFLGISLRNARAASSPSTVPVWPSINAVTVSPSSVSLSGTGATETIRIGYNVTDDNSNLSRVKVEMKRCNVSDSTACWKGQHYGTSILVQDVSFSPTSSRVANVNYTIDSSYQGLWHVFVSAYDSSGMANIYDATYCAPDYPWSPDGKTSLHCNPNAVYTVSVAATTPTYTISGYVFETGGSCSENPSTNPLAGADAATILLETDAGTRYAGVSSSGYFEFRDVPEGTLHYFSVSGVDVPDGKTLTSVCSTDNVWVDFTTGGSGLYVPASAYVLNSNLAVNFGYTLTDSMTNGWYTVVDGDFYSSQPVSFTTPNSPLGVFTGYLLQKENYNGYGFGKSFEVESTSGTQRVFATNDGGYVRNFTEELRVPNYEVRKPDSYQQLNSLTNLDPTTPYVTTVGKLNSLINAHTGYSLASPGVAVIYVERGPGNQTEIDFSKEFVRSGGVEGGLLIMGLADVSAGFGTKLGTTTPTLSPQVMAGVVVPEDIIAPSDTTTDTTLVVQGLLVSTDATIVLARNLEAANANYPGEVVVYDPMYLYELTKQGRVNEGTLPGLYLVDIAWEDK